MLKNVKIRADDKHFFSVLKAWATDLAIKLFSDRVQDRNAVATVIPIKGTLTGPDVALWPAIFGVMRNAWNGFPQAAGRATGSGLAPACEQLDRG